MGFNDVPDRFTRPFIHAGQVLTTWTFHNTRSNKRVVKPC